MRDADSSDSSEYVPTDKEEEDDDIADDLAPHLVPHLAREAVSYAATTARCALLRTDFAACLLFKVHDTHGTLDK